MNRVTLVAVATAFAAAAAGFTIVAKYDDWFVFPKTRQLVADQLSDPASAQFRNERVGKESWHCGEVNAKNGMGGYGGFKRFIAGPYNKIIYLEGAGMLGEESHEEVIAILDKQIAYNKVLATIRQADPEIPMPSESSRLARARGEVFEDHWKAICETP